MNYSNPSEAPSYSKVYERAGSNNYDTEPGSFNVSAPSLSKTGMRNNESQITISEAFEDKGMSISDMKHGGGVSANGDSGFHQSGGPNSVGQAPGISKQGHANYSQPDQGDSYNPDQTHSVGQAPGISNQGHANYSQPDQGDSYNADQTPAGISKQARPNNSETDEASTMDLDLEFRLHLGGEKAPLKKKTSSFNKLSLDIEDQDGLEVSLSSAPAESHISVVHSNNASENMNKGSVSFSVVTVPTSSGTCFSGAGQHNRNSSTKICQFNGCEKRARGASGRCISHGGGRRCQKPGCQNGATGRTAFCKAHGGGRRCEFLGCTKLAEGRTNYCIAHGGGRRCSHEACTKSAESLSGLCISHGGGRRCQFPACTRGAHGSTMYCKAHGQSRLRECLKKMRPEAKKKKNEPLKL